jgi:hypothetical protein
MSRLARYLHDLRRELAKRGRRDTRIVEEARDHLADAVEAGVRGGSSRDDAERDALARFGPPHLVAASVPRGWRMLNGTLASVTGLLIAATVWLSGSLVILAPPRANYSLWFVMASVILAHAVLTLASLVTGSASGYLRSALIAGAAAALTMSAWWGYLMVSDPHFEGFRLVLAFMLAVQGSLTLLRTRALST